MGTSSSGGGAGGNNPLIPTWIPGGAPAAPDGDGDAGPDDAGPEQAPQAVPANTNPQQQPTPPISGSRSVSRYRQPRLDFNNYVRSGGRNTDALKRSLRNYSRHAGGSTTGMARRMAPSASRVAGFLGAINTVREVGAAEALRRFNLEAYIDKPLSDTLSALSEQIFRDTAEAYANTQDDNITRNAYANTIMRVCELGGVDLDKLSNENIEVMTAIFIEETIVQRVLCDIGNNITRIEHDIERLIDIENNVYQIVNGLVRNRIMPEIIATQRGDKKTIERSMENIYRIAFDAMAEII